MAAIDKNNLLIRVAVAAVAIPGLIFLALTGGIPFLCLVSVAALLGMAEFSKIARGNHTAIPWLWLGTFSVISLWLVYYHNWEALLLVSALIFVLLAISAFRLAMEVAARSLAFSILAIIYLSQFTFWILVRELPNSSSQDYAAGGHWMSALFLLVWSCDTAAYFGGKGLGKHQLAFAISPAKTKEGAIFGILGALLAAVLMHLLFFSTLRLTDLLVVAVLVGILGQVGDLFESLFKRSAQLKDTSTIIPGHGGVLDRFDSLLFVSPWVYFYLRWFVFNT